MVSDNYCVLILCAIQSKEETLSLCLKEHLERDISRVVKAYCTARLLKTLDRALDGCNQVVTKPNAKQKQHYIHFTPSTIQSQ